MVAVAVAAAVAAAGHGLTACSALLMLFERMHQLPLTRALSELQLHPTEAARVSPVAAVLDWQVEQPPPAEQQTTLRLTSPLRRTES